MGKHPEEDNALSGFQDMVGKTVERVVVNELGDRNMFVEFTDGTWILVGSTTDWDGIAEIELADLSDMNPQDRAGYGLITAEECDRRLKAREAAQRAARTRKERAEFARLEKIFREEK
jgi:hypothetical protein